MSGGEAPGCVQSLFAGGGPVLVNPAQVGAEGQGYNFDQLLT